MFYLGGVGRDETDPRRWTGRSRFDAVVMPDRFVLECLTGTGEWIDWGLFRQADFERLEDGSYLSAANGSPMWIRCLRQDKECAYVIDGDGKPFVYRFVAFPGSGYSEV